MPPLPSMAGDDVLLPQLHFLTLIFPQLIQYHASHAMTGLEEGGDGGVSWTWLNDVSDGCGIEVGAEEGLILLFLRCDSTFHEPAIA
jgi:hypothetical protein